MLFTAFKVYPKWMKNNSEATLSWDASGYYMYLPAIFIYKDLKNLSFVNNIISKYKPTPELQQAYHNSTSNTYILKYSCGQAIAMAPWFFVADLWVNHSHKYIRDGFSFPYQFSIGIGMFIYSLIGLFFLRKILLVYFRNITVSIILLLLVLGSNYLNYSSIDQAMPHNTLFTIYTIIIWLSIKYYRKPSNVKIILIGLLCGFATLIRPTDIISILIPLLINTANLEELVGRYSYIKSNLQHLVLFVFSFIFVICIQLIYWKYTSNSWIIYSYQNQGFSWMHPHILNYLFSYRCGWILFCPLMILPFVGMIPFYFKKSNTFLVYIFTLISIYLVTAWDIWDYGSTAGRAMVQYYPILLLPLASLVEYVYTKSIIIIFSFYFILLIVVYLNIWWIYNAHIGTVKVSEVTKEYFWKTLGRWNATDNDTKLLDNKFSFNGILKDTLTLYKNSFDQDTTENMVFINNNKKIKINKRLQYSSIYRIYNPHNNRKWVRAYCNYSITEKEWDIWKQSQFIIQFYLDKNNIQNNYIRIHRLLNENKTKCIYIDAIVPKKWDYLTLQFWNATSEKELIIDDLHLISFND
jgi:hypothetical protein